MTQACGLKSGPNHLLSQSVAGVLQWNKLSHAIWWWMIIPGDIIHYVPFIIFDSFGFSFGLVIIHSLFKSHSRKKVQSIRYVSILNIRCVIIFNIDSTILYISCPWRTYSICMTRAKIVLILTFFYFLFCLLVIMNVWSDGSSYKTRMLKWLWKMALCISCKCSESCICSVAVCMNT